MVYVNVFRFHLAENCLIFISNILEMRVLRTKKVAKKKHLPLMKIMWRNKTSISL